MAQHRITQGVDRVIYGDPGNARKDYTVDIVHFNDRTHIFTARVVLSKPGEHAFYNAYTDRHRARVESFFMKVMLNEADFWKEDRLNRDVFEKSCSAGHVPPICPEPLHTRWIRQGSSSQSFLHYLFKRFDPGVVENVKYFAQGAYGVLILEDTGDTLFKVIMREVNQAFKKEIINLLLPALPLLMNIDKRNFFAERVLVADRGRDPLLNFEKLDFYRTKDKLEKNLLHEGYKPRQIDDLSNLLNDLSKHWKTNVVQRYLKYARRLLVRLASIGYLHGDYHLYNFTMRNGFIYVIDFGQAVAVAPETFAKECGALQRGESPAECVQMLVGLTHQKNLLTSIFRTDAPTRNTNDHFFQKECEKIVRAYSSSGIFAWAKLVHLADTATVRAPTLVDRLRAFLLDLLTPERKSALIQKKEQQGLTDAFEKQLYNIFKDYGNTDLRAMWEAFFAMEEIRYVSPKADTFEKVLLEMFPVLVRKVNSRYEKKEKDTLHGYLFPLLPLNNYVFEGRRWAGLMCEYFNGPQWANLMRLFTRPGGHVAELHDGLKKYVGDLFEKGKEFVTQFERFQKTPTDPLENQTFQLVQAYQKDFWFNMGRYQWVYTNRCSLDNYSRESHQFALQPESIASEEEYAAYVETCLLPFKRAAKAASPVRAAEPAAAELNGSVEQSDSATVRNGEPYRKTKSLLCSTQRAKTAGSKKKKKKKRRVFRTLKSFIASKGKYY